MSDTVLGGCHRATHLCRESPSFQAGDTATRTVGNMAEHEPVEDFATDFDHTDPAWVDDPYPIWEDLRGRCPVAHTDRYGSVWLPVNHDDVSAIAYDTEHFTSRNVVVSPTKPGPDDPPAPIGLAPPITSDPPFHHGARRLLLEAFSPRAVAALEPQTVENCHQLALAIKEKLGGGHTIIDASADYAQHIPALVIADMLGVPQTDTPKFRTFIHTVLEAVDAPEQERIEGFLELADYIDTHIATRRAHPADDLTTYLLNATLDGEPLTDGHIRGTIVLLLIAGIDTTWSAIGASLWHLAKTPGDRERLAANPDLIPVAAEEFLRAYAPVTMARLVKEDVEFAGCPMKKDDWVLLPFPAANRDPQVFDRPDEVIIDRQVNRHAAFGLGIHRCIGSNLARMELNVALRVWLEHFGSAFSIAESEQVVWAAGQVRGPRKLPVIITPKRL